jgi:predicted negative regulator of RcsB-dependent stress response
MSELKTEEEQIEAFKNWWKKNGTALVLAVSVGVAGYFGFNAWTQSQANHITEASTLYQNMLDVSVDLTQEKNQKTIGFIADQLLSDYDDTGYAAFGQLFLAKVLVEQGDLEKAKTVLENIKTLTDDVTLQAVADLRVARILMATDALDQALTLVETIQLSEFAVQTNELKGDILLKQGKRDEARVAYQAASDANTATTSHPLLNIKLQDLVKG